MTMIWGVWEVWEVIEQARLELNIKKQSPPYPSVELNDLHLK